MSIILTSYPLIVTHKTRARLRPKARGASGRTGEATEQRMMLRTPYKKRSCRCPSEMYPIDRAGYKHLIKTNHSSYTVRTLSYPHWDQRRRFGSLAWWRDNSRVDTPRRTSVRKPKWSKGWGRRGPDLIRKVPWGRLRKGEIGNEEMLGVTWRGGAGVENQGKMITAVSTRSTYFQWRRYGQLTSNL